MANYDNDPVMKMYETEAILIEREKELQEKDTEIEDMRRLIVKLQLENQRKPAVPNKPGNSEKVAKLEQELSEANAQIQTLQLALGQFIEKDDQISQQAQDIGQMLAICNSQINDQLVKMQSAIKQLSATVNVPREKFGKLIGTNMSTTGARNVPAKVQDNTSVLILNDSTERTYIYNSKARLWQTLEIMLPEKISGFGVEVLNDEIYIFGGQGSDGYTNACYKFETDGKWKRMTDMNEKRGDIENSSLVYQNEIWVIGGWNTETLTTVEKYNSSDNKWTPMPATNISRHHSAVAELNERIFVAGGVWREVTVELFDKELHKWLIFDNLPNGVQNHCMLTFAGSILVLGGNVDNEDNTWTPTNNVWKLNPTDSKQRWIEMPNFSAPREEFGVVNISNNLLIFAGKGVDDKELGTTEVFDGTKWAKGPILPNKMKNISYVSLSRSLEEKLLQQFP